MYDYEYENNVLLFLRLLKFLHTDQPEVLEEIIKDYPMAGDEDIEMIMNELMLTVFDEGAPDDEDDMVTVRFSHDYIDVKLDITLSPDCCTPDIFLNTFVNLILYCQREVERIEAVEADERNAVAYIGKEAA